MASKSERREALVRAAIDVIAEKGLSGTRVADTGERAGMSAGHVLYCFDGKADLFSRALRTIENELRASGRDFVYGREGEIVRCARHGWEFEIATGRALVDPHVRARTYPVTVEAGQVVVTV
jgi:AcrR family transcriptional regulator